MFGETHYIGVEGRGYTIAGDTRIEWRPHDVFCVPSWHWHEHGNDSGEDAIVYSVSDAPVIEWETVAAAASAE